MTNQTIVVVVTKEQLLILNGRNYFCYHYRTLLVLSLSIPIKHKKHAPVEYADKKSRRTILTNFKIFKSLLLKFAVFLPGALHNSPSEESKY